MSDPYPQTFEIEIERDKLCRYLRTQAFLGVMPSSFFMCTLIGVKAYMSDPARVIESFEWHLFLGLSMGAALGVAFGLLVYLFCHFYSKKDAQALHVTVEGQYLRVSEGVYFRRDRKLHFRAIVDYANFSGPLMRFFGIGGLTMTTTAGGMHAEIRVVGVKNAQEIRDMLSDIDRRREDLKPE